MYLIMFTLWLWHSIIQRIAIHSHVNKICSSSMLKQRYKVVLCAFIVKEMFNFRFTIANSTTT